MRAAAATVLLCLLPAPGSAENPAGEDLARCGAKATQAVQTRYGKVRDLSAAFVQSSRSVGLGGARAPTTSSGLVVLQVPGKMRWTYETPERSLLVSDGETLWLYDPAYREAQKLPVTGGYLKGAAIQFLLGQGDLEASFEIRPIACDGASAELQLVPRTDATYEYLTIWVDTSEGLIHRTELFDLLGNRTSVEFQNVEVNQNPAPEVFRFEAPEGVKVVEIAP